MIHYDVGRFITKNIDTPSIVKIWVFEGYGFLKFSFNFLGEKWEIGISINNNSPLT